MLNLSFQQSPKGQKTLLMLRLCLSDKKIAGNANSTTWKGTYEMSKLVAREKLAKIVRKK